MEASSRDFSLCLQSMVEAQTVIRVRTKQTGEYREQKLEKSYKTELFRCVQNVA